MATNLNSHIWEPWMFRAINLASLAEGQTSPNPLVGAVILDEKNRLVGEGFHLRSGEPHAEIGAIEQAGSLAKGGTLLVNLEPCCHRGKTPPCTDAILRSGIKRVVVAIQDPDQRVSGKGIAFLKESGIEVVTGILEKEAAFLNRAFIFRNRTGRPWGTLKWAMSFDGRIGLSNGKSKWISGEKSRKRVHSLRAKNDAVIVGGGTVRSDNPLLTTRGIADIEPLRVVCSSTLDLPKEAQLWNTELAKTLIFYGPESDARCLENLPSGPERLCLEENTPIKVMEALAQRGCNQVLWECGSSLATKAIQQNCVQELSLFLSPKLLGGVSAMTPLADFGFSSMEQVFKLKEVSSNKSGEDFVLNMLFDNYG
ncbi:MULTISPECIES: bifunctional diaminohydroxyphosphoribosylaminopyrimidine deaminase/5-amino-6-(5-phosphoribosylamino)uracil reductase RibD [Prochlorococcus]|uniref:Riboflavin biosynthesis protein RibD n=1 Tax=Prochlorococcus marinus (strain SARG / CCMP1375 / SS120) TaxID=167539 RepID=Q7VAW4_PROMA|nr:MULTISPECIES: bifunctional diaminohydroxyphosphoribosylaminopyrimidine deaminase/5-amino-6-(5-phosphoribosylamino)uracil reductase RibD [Prochlorococcus]AAQ00383.1 Pyrimidine reductase [Prochlorococcus marinus subsp. marinus str. CCMP1375]KGG14263.1 Diaminohydroxyphosphoribosylaminopyrimidine deaminase [Prochlorococcus marinus str. LG]KGG22164.1 Diaminohydroxyphosphoribosylaminopyrimidine deaminase [Prochlorococcus marinus str. SS2]KGG24518.1 Diaminohydroxyphosphoribosylaminopyrimidine deami